LIRSFRRLRAMISSELINRALSQIGKRDATYKYFFDNLNSPEWIEPLYERGMFQNPPKPECEGDSIGFPIWPESRYLARMATAAPEKVLEIALKIPYTENVRVYEDLADAALGMPATLAARLVPKAKDWLKKPYKMLLPEKLGELVTHLSKGGQINDAVDLAGAILEVLPDPREEEESETGRTPLFSPEPHARIDVWDYKRILEKQVPGLIESAGLGLLSMLCDRLYNAVLFSRSKRQIVDQEDYSYIWRPAIEEHGQNRDHDIRGFLISAVRDAGEKLIESEGKSALDLIEKGPLKVFLRIGLYLRRRFPDLDPEGTESLITKPSIYDDISIWHEFFRLLKDSFGSFSEESQREYLSLVRKGPEPEDIRGWAEYQAEERNHQVNQEEIDRYVRHWQYEKLIPIQTYLDDEWRKRFDRFKQEFGEPEHPSFHVHVGATWIGPTSPKDMEELRSMTIDELIPFLKSWQPSGQHMSPSPEGLGRQLAALVKSEPDRFAEQASKFKGIEPTYVRAILSGLRDAIKDGRSLRWLSVIDLCQWAVGQPRETPSRGIPYANRDPGWGWARKSMADLLSAGFEPGEAETPFGCRSSVWAVIKPITDDPEPTHEDESKRNGTELDPASLSINTARGEALHAVVRYALWVRRNIEKGVDAKLRLERGFDEMPEVREVFNRHLDLDHDKSLAIRSVYGQWFPWLVLLDSGWAAKNLPSIFPREDALRDYYKAAWDTYLLFCRPYDKVLDLLYEEYERAIKRLGNSRQEKRRHDDPEERLAEHLMSYYWRGKLNLDDPKGLIAQFYDKASGSLCAHAIEFMGRTLYRTKEEIDPETLGRFQKLWEQRIAIIKAEDSREGKIESSAFGWWFASGNLDDSWSITQLKEVLDIADNIEPNHLVVERLATLVNTMPMASVYCLRKLVESDRKGWHIEGWRRHARTILTIAIQSDDAKAREASIDLIHTLGARGFRGFRDLLPTRKKL
jgi:hypothetical protein